MARFAIAGLIVVGSVLLWTALPAGWLWLGHRLSEQQETAYGIALLGALPSMVAWGWALYGLQLIHSRLSGDTVYRGDRSGWLKGLSAEPRSSRGTLLETSLVLSALLSLVAFALWLILGPAAPWPSWNPLAR
jgi:hypothetical protein